MIDATFFTKNRKKLVECTNDTPLVFTGHTKLQRRSDSEYAFSQEANFWYLTGIDEADWQLIVEPKEGKSYLVQPDIDEVHRIFSGGMTADEALTRSGAEACITAREAERLLSEYAKEYDAVCTLGPDPHKSYYDFSLNPAPERLRQKLDHVFTKVNDCRLQLAKLRAIKAPEEIAALRRAIAVTVDAFTRVGESLPQLTTEYEVEAEFTYRFRRSGADGHAYDPIVAAGKNACTLHYNKNKASLKDGELLLLDIGAAVDGYAADITRTFAVGAATPRQREVHAAVQRAHTAIIELLEPGLSVATYHEKVDDIMKQALQGLGLMKNGDDPAYRTYFPHAISHGLGIDVHDSLGRPETFQAGMVLTVEPGIYIPEEGIGVRLEDDILITKDGHENLSQALSLEL